MIAWPSKHRQLEQHFRRMVDRSLHYPFLGENYQSIGSSANSKTAARVTVLKSTDGVR